MPELPELNSGDALLVVDVQQDFCPGGALEVPQGDAVVPVLNRWMDAARRAGAIIVASRDWHPVDHCSFHAQGGTWPAHCVRGTSGAEFHPQLALSDDVRVLSKATESNRESYSAFDGTGLAAMLKDKSIQRVWMGGLALDVCVKASAFDSVEAGFETHVILDATRAVDVHEGDGERAVDEMRAAGAVVEEGGGR